MELQRRKIWPNSAPSFLQQEEDKESKWLQTGEKRQRGKVNNFL